MTLPTARLPLDVVAGPAALVSLCAIAIVVLGVVGAARRPADAGATFAAHAGFALELFLAAGLIRLAALNSLRALGTVAAIVAIRQVIGRGVRLGARTPRAARALAPADRGPSGRSGPPGAE